MAGDKKKKGPKKKGEGGSGVYVLNGNSFPKRNKWARQCDCDTLTVTVTVTCHSDPTEAPEGPRV